ncbi:predicted protein [Histoplasma mississippiense (nom. inval.)]|uniref:predicted protein n=1 Tax=Ajellomyces capsulatus (strain NAm1 / WU24) TaxID=2059318 RepID=UPI000157B953|nr:predicted protein [Histoplasma mississippiense (nom. inval.)]EDN03340.1 predicted protein [Histoplasma mississippiense (nom. inval.)]
MAYRPLGIGSGEPSSAVCLGRWIKPAACLFAHLRHPVVLLGCAADALLTYFPAAVLQSVGRRPFPYKRLRKRPHPYYNDFLPTKEPTGLRKPKPSNQQTSTGQEDDDTDEAKEIQEPYGGEWHKRTHFVIAFNQKGQLVLKDISSQRTAVSYDGRGSAQWRRHFQWMLVLDKPRETRIHLPNDFYLDIIFPDHASCQRQYEENVQRYVQESQNQLFDFGGMALLSKDQTRPRTPINDPIYFHVKRIGKGAFGAVNKVINVSTGDIYASKRIQIDDLADLGHNRVEVGTKALEHDSLEEAEFAKEIQNIKSTAHEHIIEFVDSTTNPLQLIMEYLPLGNLYDQHERDPLNTEETQLLLAQGLDALRYLHSENITHRDIKPENILVRGRKELFHIKLADFGLSKIGNSMRSKLGTKFYDAPEVFGRMRNGERYDNKVDVWSFGVVVLEVSGRLPDLYRKQNYHSYIADAAKKALDACPNSQFYYLMSRMLKINSTERAFIADLFDGKTTIEFSIENNAHGSRSATPTNRGLHKQADRVSASPDDAKPVTAVKMKKSPTQKRQQSQPSSRNTRVKRTRKQINDEPPTQLETDKTVRNAAPKTAKFDPNSHQRPKQDDDGVDFHRSPSGVIGSGLVGQVPGSTYSSRKQRELQAGSLADPSSQDNNQQENPGAGDDEATSRQPRTAIPPDRVRRSTTNPVSRE